ncbi:MAG: hypothetical protein QOD81_3691 [Solirubrobacteraceae bacterium]|nr:hypothetical protein [Solirubrobacteraceae bacterium]
MAMLPAQVPDGQGPIHEIRPRLAGSPSRGLAARSDEGLVTLARQGDERAFATLYERHAPAIQRYCRSLLRSPQEAEDVSQEVFVLAISALRRGTEPVAFRPWLYKVAHNACMSHLRARRPVLVADHGVLVGPGATAEPGDGHREDLRQLIDDIGTLPAVQRAALLLSRMDGFSYEQVGEALGLPPATVRASIFRARRTLQGLAEARDADCETIRSELSRLADRRGRRGRHITSHLAVCGPCREYREGQSKGGPRIARDAVPRAYALSPVAALMALKAKILGGTTAGGIGAAAATAGGGMGVAKLAAAAASTCALVAGVGGDDARLHARAAPPSASAVVSPPPAAPQPPTASLLARTRTRASPSATPLPAGHRTRRVASRAAGTAAEPTGGRGAQQPQPAGPPPIASDNRGGGRPAPGTVGPTSEHGSPGTDRRPGTSGDRDEEGEADRSTDAPRDEPVQDDSDSGHGSSGSVGGSPGSSGPGGGGSGSDSSSGSGSGREATGPRPDDHPGAGDADVASGGPAPTETVTPAAPDTPDGSAARRGRGGDAPAADSPVDGARDTPISGPKGRAASAPGGEGPSGPAAPGPDHPVATAAERSIDPANGTSAPPGSTGAAPQRR